VANPDACKIHPRKGFEDLERKFICSYSLSLTSALDMVRDQRQSKAAYTPRNKTSTRVTAGSVGPRNGLDVCGKSRPEPGFDPWTKQTVTSRYTDWAFAAHFSLKVKSGQCVQEVTCSAFNSIIICSHLIPPPYSSVHPRPTWPYCFLSSPFRYLL